MTDPTNDPPPFAHRPPPPAALASAPPAGPPAAPSSPPEPTAPDGSTPRGGALCRWWWMAAAVVVALLAGIGLGAASNASRVSELEDDNEQLAAQVDSLQGDQEAADDGEQELADAADRNDELAGQVDDLNGQIDDLSGEVDDLTAERDALQDRVDELEAEQPPPPPPAPETLHFEGTGATVVDLPSPIVRGQYVLAHSGSSNFAIWALDETGGRIDLIVNEIGQYQGTVVAGDDFGSTGTAKLEVDADGYWTIDITVLD